MKRIFISYSPADSEVAMYLATQLRARGVDLFIDYARMMDSGTLTRRISNEIRSRDCVVVLQSQEAQRDSLVQNEVNFANDHQIPIIPVQVQPTHDRQSDTIVLFNGNSREAVNQIERRLRQQNGYRSYQITTETVGQLAEHTTLIGHTSWVRKASFAPDGTLVASCGNDNSVRLWDTNGRQIANLEGHRGSVWDVTFSHDSQMLASCGNDNTVRIWDLNDYTTEFTRFVDHHEPVYALTFSPDGRFLASASYDHSIHVRDIARIRTTGIAEAVVPLLHASHAYSVAFSPDSGLIASASRDSAVRVWRIDSDNIRNLVRTHPSVLSGHVSWVNNVSFSPSGNLIASTSHDETIKLWDVETLSTVATLRGHQGSVNTAVFSPDGSLLVTTSKDQTVRLWSVEEKRQIAVLDAHDGWVNSAVFSADGRYLATASGDQTVKLWRVKA